jgi:cytidine deaminase
MREFSKDLDIVLTKPGDDTVIRVVTLSALLPESFGPEDLP